jgi:hypothetical protein
MPSVGFESAIPAIQRLQTHTTDRKPTGIGLIYDTAGNNYTPHIYHYRQYNPLTSQPCWTLLCTTQLQTFSFTE